MADDNVLFAHATRVMSALHERGQDFQLMTYPGGKHGINSSPAQRLHVYRQIASYLQQCLQPGS
jgi:dipeptidyl-peptidase-4